MEISPVDTEALRSELKGGGPWAVQCGSRITARRAELELSQHDLSILTRVPTQTIWRIEKGVIVPRDYLRVAIAQALGCDVQDLWPWPSRQRVAEIAGTA